MRITSDGEVDAAYVCQVEVMASEADDVCKVYPPRRLRQLVLVASIAIATIVAGPGCIASSPDTPENAVMNYLTSAQLGDYGATDGLCERLRERPGPDEMKTIEQIVHHSRVFGEGLISREGNSATVALEVLFSPSQPGARGDPWVVHMQREDGRWRVCGFEPA